jgi:hypothetical protein
VVVSDVVMSSSTDFYGDATGAPLLPLFAALGAFPGTLDGSVGGLNPTTFSGHSPVAQDEGGPTACSAKACRVVMPSISLVVFGYSWLSS